jgi:pyruvate ferredoxin oxidoreductase alpha subunit
VVALGSVLGTIEDTIDELRDDGVRIGALSVKTFRPWPLDEVREALAAARRVIVLEKAMGVGIGGIVSLNVRIATQGHPAHVHTVIAGLGGRPITKASLRPVLTADELPLTTFLDLDRELVQRELERRSGPHAENILRDLGAVASGPV